jgi:GNAT superfamily N-acetyltransferase
MIHAMETKVTIRLLQDNHEDMAALQRVLESAPTYAERVTGAPPGAADAQSMFTILPEANSYDDKFVFGIFLGSRMIGCIDIIRGYPAASTATVGLLLVAERYQRTGVGRLAYAELERLIQAWGCVRVRLGVVMTNSDVIAFWQKLGFSETVEMRPYDYGRVHSHTIIMEKSLRS